MKNKKKIIILVSIIIICIILASLIFINRNQIIKIVRKMSNLETKEITYEAYFNQDNKMVVLLKVIDTENGINEIQLPDGDKIICNGKEQVGVDYIIDGDGIYTFTSKSTTGETIEKTLNIDEIIEELIENGNVLKELASNEYTAKKIVSSDKWFEQIKNIENNANFFDNININATEELTLVNVENPYYTFEAKANQSYFIQCYGGQGGVHWYHGHGGYGGYSCGTIIPNQDTTLYIYKGGAGVGTVPNSGVPGGYNGGGAIQYGWGDSNEKRSSGGGATHIALVPRIIIKFRK